MTAVAPTLRPDLDDLAATANRHHAMACGAANLWLQHASEVGRALVAAQADLSAGEWSAWCTKHLEFSRHMAASYMRVACYADLIEADQAPQSMSEALAALRLIAPRRKVDPRITAETQRLIAKWRSEGATWDAIGESLGISRQQAQYWGDPDYHKRKRRQVKAAQQKLYRARRALELQERAQLVSRVGGDAAAAYADLRRCLQRLDTYRVTQSDPTVVGHLSNAYNFGTQMEAAIVAALRAVR